MRKILLRGGKDPFTPVSAIDTLEKNILGTNSGNLIFSLAAHKTLSTPTQNITMGGYTSKNWDAQQINAEYDYLVLPFANAFRLSWKKTLANYIEVLKNVNIPIIILGVGVQASLNYNFKQLKPINGLVKNFMDLVLQNSPSVGVRGECTAEYLKYLGYDSESIDIIGCPSMFYYGAHLPLKKTSPIHKKSAIAFNASPYVTDIDKIALHNYEYYKKFFYITQNNRDLNALIYKSFPKTKKSSQLYDINSPIFTNNKMGQFIDPQPWFKFLAKQDFAFGTRIHGNIAALLAGTPCHVLAHDSRTLELAKYFEIPYSLYPKVPKDILAEELAAQSDYTQLLKNHPLRFETYQQFLAKHNLDSIFNYNYLSKKYDNAYFNTKLSQTISSMPPTPTLLNTIQEWFK